MIQEKDFLYRVPVKNSLITIPGQNVRNPEILIDIEGGEFMCGNILDANSTNKLINQFVKDAIGNGLRVENNTISIDPKYLTEAITFAYDKKITALEARIAALEAKHTESAA